MTTQEQSTLLPLSRCRVEYGLSDSTLRRAIRLPVDALPCVRVGLGDPKHARILIRRGDLDAWIARRQSTHDTPKALVDEIVGKALGQ